MWEITITADGNDGDYQTEVSEISDTDLNKLKPLFQAIKAFKPYKTGSAIANDQREHRHNWPSGECLRTDLGEKPPHEIYNATEELTEMLEEYLPYNEWGIHTIVSVEVTPLVKKTRLL